MTIPFWCLSAVLLMPILLAFLGGNYRKKAFGAVDNKNPRAQVAQLEGTGARVQAAQENAWEASVLFTAAILTTHLAGLSAEAATPWAIAFVVFRVLHAVFYVQNLDKARSAVFIGSFICVIGLFVIAA